MVLTKSAQVFMFGHYMHGARSSRKLLEIKTGDAPVIRFYYCLQMEARVASRHARQVNLRGMSDEIENQGSCGGFGNSGCGRGVGANAEANGGDKGLCIGFGVRVYKGFEETDQQSVRGVLRGGRLAIGDLVG